MATEMSVYLNGSINERINLKSYYTNYQGGNALGLLKRNSSSPLINGEEMILSVWMGHDKRLMQELTQHLHRFGKRMFNKSLYTITHAWLQLAGDDF